MDFKELKLKALGIEKEKFGRIFCFVDYGNVNYWYEKDRFDQDKNSLNKNQKIIIDIEKLTSFCSEFSDQKRFYYGWNPRIQRSWHILIKAEKNGFIKNTKPMQFIKHYVGSGVVSRDGRNTKKDFTGTYIEIAKSNFDVEISVDAVRTIEKYDTFCLFSGDSDFTYLARYLKKQNKKFIVIASGQVFHTLKEIADLYINAQDVKGLITSVKENPAP